MFYDLSMALSKIAILALLVRIFTLDKLWFKIGIYFWLTWTILWWIAAVFVVFLECRPLSSNWGVPYQCRPAFGTAISVAIVNTVSDVGILFLAQPIIWNLHLPLPKKFMLSGVFMIGIL